MSNTAFALIIFGVCATIAGFGILLAYIGFEGSSVDHEETQKEEEQNHE